MVRLSIEKIIEKIQAQEPLDAVAQDYSFTIKIDRYVHYVCAAIHDGSQFRKELWEKCLHTAYERWYEEDPCTKYFIETHPIVIAGRDSRFEYDLNRAPDKAIYEDAWGKQLWSTSLSTQEKAKSLEKHTAFYKVIHALMTVLENLHDRVVVYDMHSYNWKRWEREVPVVNLGTNNIDNHRFKSAVEQWFDALKKIELPNNIKTTAGINDTFQGNGYFLKYITQHFKNSLVLATEFSKIYCDENSQILFPEVVQAIEKQMRDIVATHAQDFKALRL